MKARPALEKVNEKVNGTRNLLKYGASEGTRTLDLRFTKPMLYQLSYAGCFSYLKQRSHDTRLHFSPSSFVRHALDATSETYTTKTVRTLRLGTLALEGAPLPCAYFCKTAQGKGTKTLRSILAPASRSFLSPCPKPCDCPKAHF